MNRAKHCVTPTVLSVRITMYEVDFHRELSAIDCVFGSLSVVFAPVEAELPEQELAVSFQRRSCRICASSIIIEGFVLQPVLACACIAPASWKNAKNIKNIYHSKSIYKSTFTKLQS